MTKIGIISDPHATSAPVAEAMAIFRNEAVSHVLCAGDIAGYGEQLDETVELLVENDCKSISGNHDTWYLQNSADSNHPADQYLQGLPATLQFSIEGKSIYMVHASPPDSSMNGIRLLDQNGIVLPQQKDDWGQRLADFSYDVLVVGHTHQVFAQQIADTLVINPGSPRFNHSCAILQLPSLQLEFFALSGKAIQASWNWGMCATRGR